MAGYSAGLRTLVVLAAAGAAFGEDPLGNAIRDSQALTAQGNPRAASQLLEAALESHTKTSDPASLAIALNELGSLYLNLGRLTESERILKQAIAVAERRHGKVSFPAWVPMNNLAMVYTFQRRFARAQQVAEKILDWRRNVLGDEDPSVGASYTLLSNIHFQRGNRLEAARCATLAITILESAPGQPEVRASALNILALVQAAEGDVPGALVAVRRALISMEQVLTPDHPGFVPYLLNLGALHIRLQQWSSAEGSICRALAIVENRFAGAHPQRAQSLALLAAVYRNTDRVAEAKRASKTAKEIIAGYRQENAMDDLVSVEDLARGR